MSGQQLGNTVEALDQVKEFLKQQGYDLLEGHMSGYASGNVLAKHFAEALKNYETWYVIIQKIGDSKSAKVERVVYRPTREGLKLEWGDAPNN